MVVDKSILNKIAHLARLEVRSEEEEKMLNELSGIISWVEKLKEVDTEGVEPLTSMSLEMNRLREDEVLPHLDRDKALNQAPKKSSEYFRVPKVLK